MAGIAIGTIAPSFRLPSGQGGEVALDDYRGRKNLLVWFTKGMACTFCRAQMSRLSRVYPELQRRDAELLEISISTPKRAKIYAEKFRIPFPYLADSDYRVRREWGLGHRSNGPIYYVQAFLAGSKAKAPPNDYGDFAPTPGEFPKLLADDDMGFFIVDKSGVVRYAMAGSYTVPEGESFRDRPLPSNEEILGELERCG